MKKLVVLLSLVAGLYANAQCFVLRDTVSNGTIQADPSPGSYGTFLFIGAGEGAEPPYPINTRKFSWDLGRLVHGTFRAYGYMRDNPNTPENETNWFVWYENSYIAPCYNGTITRRFSECDVSWMSSYADTEKVREFVLQVTLYDAYTDKYVNTAYLRWTR